MLNGYLRSIVVSSFVLCSLGADSQNPLPIPDTISGTSFPLLIKDTTHVFYSGFNTSTIGINGDYLGPTLFLNKGDSVSMLISNQLADTTTVHWHGMHVSSLNDGGPHTVIPPGTLWNPTFRVRDFASTFWYHAHLHMKTNLHATKGLAGLVIVRDSAEASLTLPRRYGVDDFPLVIQSKSFDNNKQIVVGDHLDSVMMVNGARRPVLSAPAQVIRLRLLNASTNRMYRVGFTGNLNFYQIASDGGLLSASISMTRLNLAPGERAEILIDLTGKTGQTIYLMNFGTEIPNGFYGAANPSAMAGTITGYSSNPLNGNNFSILEIQVGSATINPVTVIPSALTPVQILNPANANITRQITFSPVVMGPNAMLNGPFQFNGSPFDMNVINYQVPLNNTEIWVLTNQTAIAHPFHLHDVQYFVYDINGSPPPANQQGRKDVIMVPAQQTVRFVTQFEDFCDSTIPYMYHCHMLSHEDDGMMGQLVVTCPATGIGEQTASESFNVFPNPSEDWINLSDGIQGAYRLIDGKGRIVHEMKIADSVQHINIKFLPSGLYMLEWIGKEGRTQRVKFIKQ